jgi:hypothetical protein
MIPAPWENQPGGHDPLDTYFEAVHQFAGTQSLSGDATAVLVRW